MGAFVSTERRIHPAVRGAVLLGLLYLFLVGIQLLSATFKGLGKEQAEALIQGISNPFAGLAVGILATVLVQSSSVTTAFVVGIVTVGELTPEAISAYVPVIMGANIGTTVTNTLVSMGHMRRSAEFRRAFAGATVHDFFNLICVAIFLPIEIMTGVLGKSAVWLVNAMQLNTGVEYKSPIKSAVKAGAKEIQGWLGEGGLGVTGNWFAALSVVAAIALLMTALVWITRNMRVLMAGRIEQTLNRALEKSGLLGILLGVLITVSVQSSSITTSLLIPMFGAGLLRLDAGFPILLGANIGTTVTALLAAVVKGPAGLAIAIVHLLFNLGGTLLFFPFKKMRSIPIYLARRLAFTAQRRRIWVLVYVVGAFVVGPLLGILLFR